MRFFKKKSKNKEKKVRWHRPGWHGMPRLLLLLLLNWADVNGASSLVHLQLVQLAKNLSL